MILGYLIHIEFLSGYRILNRYNLMIMILI